MSFILVVIGIAFLYLGGEGLVRGATALGQRLGLSPLVVGLTVVAFGTSAPELAASFAAAWQGSTEMAFGNVVGSNIANLGLILGLTILVQELRAESRFLRREVPFLLAITVLVVPFAWSGRIGRLEGLVFLLLMIPYLVVLFSGEERPEIEQEFDRWVPHRGLSVWSLLGVVVGSAFLVAGAKMVVMGGSEIARAYGVSERVIGLTVLALGTSLPELASSVVAAIKGEADIVLGNLVGSNVCNILVILGAVSMAYPISVPRAAFSLDLWVMLAYTLVLFPLLRGGRRLRRREGLVLLGLYLAYVAVLGFGPEGPHAG